MRKIFDPEFQKAMHENAIAHGWWEEDRPDEEILALVHSELSEALEAFRDGCDPRFVYYAVPILDTGLDGDPCCPYKPEYRCTTADKELYKPEGVGVELADAVIRLLDWAVARGVDVSGFNRDLLQRKYFQLGSFPAVIGSLHKAIADLGECYPSAVGPIPGSEIGNVLRVIGVIAEVYEMDLERCVGIKHQYNLTRPYRHGGKKV